MRTEHLSRLTPALLASVLALVACRQDMHDQPKYESLEATAFFADGRTSRPRIAGTVARGEPIRDAAVETGRTGRRYVREIPLPVTKDLILRGQERFNIYCSVCHDRVGTGGGMIVQRGFRRPESFHTPRLRRAPAGYFFDVMTNGFGAMPSYTPQIPAHDRWAITAYVRALQLSQGAALADVPPAMRQRLERAK